MNYMQAIQESHQDPQKLEKLYQQAWRQDETEEFKSGLLACYQERPDNLLYAAWYYRLQEGQPVTRLKTERSRNWKLAIPLSVVTGLIFWALSTPELEFLQHLPYIVLLWAPLATLSALAFLSLTAGKEYRRAGLIGLGLVIACLYILLLTPRLAANFQRSYLELMAIHLPLLCWIALGVYILGFGSSAANRFAFLIKSIEVMITAGLYLIAGTAFGGITIGLFAALNITLPEIITRLIYAGGFGLLPILAIASVYDPTLTPLEQDFYQGLSKLIATMMRLFLPLTLGVLAIYIVAIPFSFMQPFKNREVLIVYNGMLFAIMGLLVGATPHTNPELSPRLQKLLRSGILAVASLTILVSLYALSATLYRTALGGITLNRFTIIGWNVINVSLLVMAVVGLFKVREGNWVERLKSVYRTGTLAYSVWTVVLILITPFLFGL